MAEPNADLTEREPSEYASARIGEFILMAANIPGVVTPAPTLLRMLAFIIDRAFVDGEIHAYRQVSAKIKGVK